MCICLAPTPMELYGPDTRGHLLSSFGDELRAGSQVVPFAQSDALSAFRVGPPLARSSGSPGQARMAAPLTEPRIVRYQSAWELLRQFRDIHDAVASANRTRAEITICTRAVPEL